MDDLIDRQDAINALNNILANYVPYLHGFTECIPLDCAVAIKALPSVQQENIACGSGELVQEPDGLVKVLVKDCISRSQALNAINVGGDLEGAWRNVAKLPSLSQNVHVPIKDADCISRQQAIEALDKRFDNIPMEQTTEILMLRKDLRGLPSVQSGKTCCGYDVKELIAFAIACRKAGVDEKDLKYFAQNCESAWRLMQEEFEQAIKKTIEKWSDDSYLRCSASKDDEDDE